MQHTPAVIILSFLLLLFLAGASSPLWLRNEQSRAYLSGLFVWLVPAGCIVFGGVIIWTGITDYFSGSSESRWTVINALLAVVLVCIGSTLLFEFSFKRRMEFIEMQRLKQRYPASPWKWNRRWRSNIIEYSDTRELIFSYLMLAFVIAGITVSSITQKEEWLTNIRENRLDSIILLYMVVIGLLLAFRFAVKATVRWNKLRRSSFVMATFPGVIGGKIEGEIRTRSRHVPNGGFDLKLSCIEMDATFRTSFQSIAETVLWEAQKNVSVDKLRMGTHGIVFPISFSIPADTKESDTALSNRRIHWVLSVQGTDRDSPFTAAFRIPVFRVSAQGTNPAFHKESNWSADQEKPSQ